MQVMTRISYPKLVSAVLARGLCAGPIDVGPPGERRSCYHAPHPAHSSAGVHLSTNLAPAQGSEFAGTAEPRSASVATPLGGTAGCLEAIGVVVEWPT